jgi:hypothetical protein
MGFIVQMNGKPDCRWKINSTLPESCADERMVWLEI